MSDGVSFGTPPATTLRFTSLCQIVLLVEGPDGVLAPYASPHAFQMPPMFVLKNEVAAFEKRVGVGSPALRFCFAI